MIKSEPEDEVEITDETIESPVDVQLDYDQRFEIAKKHYNERNYPEAVNNVLHYISMTEGSRQKGAKKKVAVAYHFLGNAYLIMGHKLPALSAYKTSFRLDGRKRALVLAICKLLSDPDVSMDAETDILWQKKAEYFYPDNPVTMELQKRFHSLCKRKTSRTVTEESTDEEDTEKGLELNKRLVVLLERLPSSTIIERNEESQETEEKSCEESTDEENTEDDTELSKRLLSNNCTRKYKHNWKSQETKFTYQKPRSCTNKKMKLDGTVSVGHYRKIIAQKSMEITDRQLEVNALKAEVNKLRDEIESKNKIIQNKMKIIDQKNQELEDKDCILRKKIVENEQMRKELVMKDRMLRITIQENEKFRHDLQLDDVDRVDVQLEFVAC